MTSTSKTSDRFFCAPVFFLVLMLSSSPILASAGVSAEQLADQFDHAIKNGDTVAIRKLLHRDVLIFESGNIEASLEEYASHHMGADIAFMSGMEKKVLSRKVFEQGDMAVVSTRYRMRGGYKGRFIDKITMETLVLRKSGVDWKIVHIHWS